MPFHAKDNTGLSASRNACGLDPRDPRDPSQAEHADPLLAQAVIEGLEDLAAGRLMNERELDEAQSPGERSGAATGSAGGR